MMTRPTRKSHLHPLNPPHLHTRFRNNTTLGARAMTITSVSFARVTLRLTQLYPANMSSVSLSPWLRRRDAPCPYCRATITEYVPLPGVQLPSQPASPAQSNVSSHWDSTNFDLQRAREAPAHTTEGPYAILSRWAREIAEDEDREREEMIL